MGSKKAPLALRSMAAGLLATGFLSAWLLGSGSANAQTIPSQSYQVSIVVPATCAVSSAEGFSFGNYTGAALDAQGPAVSVVCNESTSATIGLNFGRESSPKCSGPPKLCLTDAAGDSLDYGVYSDPARTVPWDSQSGTVSITGSGVPVVLTAYGRLYAGQPALPGSYADTVTATVQF